jgi:hypothetical protein
MSFASQIFNSYYSNMLCRILSYAADSVKAFLAGASTKKPPVNTGKHENASLFW